jgi:hypothetical protein
MHVDYAIRMGMLGLIKDEITGSGASKFISFMNSSNVTLLDLPFNDMETVSGIGDKAAFKFKALDDTHVLRGAAIVAGVVVKFKVFGTGGLSDVVLDGTVGSLTSTADLKFSRTTWNIGTFIIIQDLMISMS